MRVEFDSKNLLKSDSGYSKNAGPIKLVSWIQRCARVFQGGFAHFSNQVDRHKNTTLKRTSYVSETLLLYSMCIGVSISVSELLSFFFFSHSLFLSCFQLGNRDRENIGLCFQLGNRDLLCKPSRLTDRHDSFVKRTSCVSEALACHC